MRRGGAWTLGVLVGVLLMGAANEHAWFKVHTVRKGESVTAIAKQYYGEVWKYAYIKAANRLDDITKVEPGIRLRLPDVIDHLVQPGDSYAKLSLAYFGNKEFFELILWANNKKTMEAPTPGTTVRIPHVLKHAVQPGEKLEEIATFYYQDKAMALLLKQWNHLTKKSLNGVTTIWLPIRDGIVTGMPTPMATPSVTPTAEATPPPVTATPTQTPTPEPPPVTMVHKPKESITVRPLDDNTPSGNSSPEIFDATSMVLAKEQMRAGRYAEALAVMRKISSDAFKTASQMSDYYWQLFQCRVAMGQQNEALQALQNYLNVGEEDLAALRVQLPQLSPKIRAVVEIYEQRQSDLVKTSQPKTK